VSAKIITAMLSRRADECPGAAHSIAYQYFINDLATICNNFIWNLPTPPRLCVQGTINPRGLRLMVYWRDQANALHASVPSSVCSRNYHLSVERQRGVGWAWTSWHCDQPNGLVRHGTARTSTLAMIAAERVASDWDRELTRIARVRQAA
jgi:hypothetical protein